MKLFTTEACQEALARASTWLSKRTAETTFEESRDAHLQTVFNSMRQHAEEWERFCKVNVKYIGNKFLTRLIELSSASREEDQKENLDVIYASMYRFLLELYLSTKGELSSELGGALGFPAKNLDQFSQSAKDQLEFAFRDMPITILKDLLSTDHIDSVKNLDKLVELADAKKSQWDEELNAREQRINQIKDALQQYQTAFNFIGLYQGFDDLAKDKSEALKSATFWLRVFGVLVLTPIVAEGLYMAWRGVDQDAFSSLGLLAVTIPTASLVVIFIYYFRIALHDCNSLKSQMLQIDLRKTLCRFIQSYADSSEELKKKNSESLAKFENLIFAQIAPSDQKLPSTYDGIEQLAELIKAVKK